MSYHFKAKAEIKSRNRGRAISFVLHTVLLLVMFLPFFAMKMPEPPTKEALVFQFDYPYNSYIKPEKFETKLNTMKDMDMGSKMSGSEAGGSPVSEEPAQSRPQQSAPSKLSTPATTPAVTSVSRTSSALSSPIGEIPLPKPSIQAKQAWAPVQESGSYERDNVEAMKFIDGSSGSFGDVPGSGPGDGDDDSSIWSDGFGSGTGGQGGSGGGTGSGTGRGSGPGGGTGAGSAGRNTGVGQDGSGMQWGVGLDGLLNRKLVQRANVASLATKEGKVTIFICVDRSGKVISTKYDVAGSTLRDPVFATKAEVVAQSYIFAPDDTAPEKQCGKLAFIFKIK